MSDIQKTTLLRWGTWITIGTPVIIEIVSGYSFDWILLDMEHGYLTESTLLPSILSVKNSEMKKIIRIPTLDPALVARVLDKGASGIMIPHVTTAEQVETCVRAMRFPPLGTRSYSRQARCFNYGLDTPKEINSSNPPILIAQIENYEGVINSESIAQVPGVDVLFVGPSDLKLDLNTRSNSTFDFNEAIMIIAMAALKNTKQAGIIVKDINDIPAYRHMGFDCLAVDSDLGILQKGYQSLIKQLLSI